MRIEAQKREGTSHLPTVVLSERLVFDDHRLNRSLAKVLLPGEVLAGHLGLERENSARIENRPAAIALVIRKAINSPPFVGCPSAKEGNRLSAAIAADDADIGCAGKEL